MRKVMLGLTGVVAGIFMMAGTANALPESIVQLYAEPGTFYLQGAQDTDIVDFDSVQRVEICVGRDQSSVPLKIDYRNKEATIMPGNCMTVEAKSVAIEPAEELPSGVVMKGTYRLR